MRVGTGRARGGGHEEEGVRRRASKTERGRGGERARGGEGEPCRQSISVRTEKEGE